MQLAGVMVNSLVLSLMGRVANNVVLVMVMILGIFALVVGLIRIFRGAVNRRDMRISLKLLVVMQMLLQARLSPLL
jgi:hypothetical protein